MPACLASSSWARCSWISASVFEASARSSAPCACSTSALNRSGSISNSGSPTLTAWPSSNLHRLQIAFHAGADFDLFHRVDAADEIGALRHFLFLRGNDADANRRLGERAGARGDRCREQDERRSDRAGPQRREDLQGAGTGGHRSISSGHSRGRMTKTARIAWIKKEKQAVNSLNGTPGAQ